MVRRDRLNPAGCQCHKASNWLLGQPRGSSRNGAECPQWLTRRWHVGLHWLVGIPAWLIHQHNSGCHTNLFVSSSFSAWDINHFSTWSSRSCNSWWILQLENSSSQKPSSPPVRAASTPAPRGWEGLQCHGQRTAEESLPRWASPCLLWSPREDFPVPRLRTVRLRSRTSKERMRGRTTAPCPEARTITCEHPYRGGGGAATVGWIDCVCVYVHKRYFCRFLLLSVLFRVACWAEPCGYRAGRHSTTTGMVQSIFLHQTSHQPHHLYIRFWCLEAVDQHMEAPVFSFILRLFVWVRARVFRAFELNQHTAGEFLLSPRLGESLQRSFKANSSRICSETAVRL